MTLAQILVPVASPTAFVFVPFAVSAIAVLPPPTLAVLDEQQSRLVAVSHPIAEVSKTYALRPWTSEILTPLQVETLPLLDLNEVSLHPNGVPLHLNGVSLHSNRVSLHLPNDLPVQTGLSPANLQPFLSPLIPTAVVAFVATNHDPDVASSTVQIKTPVSDV